MSCMTVKVASGVIEAPCSLKANAVCEARDRHDASTAARLTSPPSWVPHRLLRRLAWF